MEVKKPWLNHYPPEIPETVDYNKKPLHSFLLESGEAFAKKKAVHFMGKEFTFGEILSEAKKTAHFFQLNGLKKGDRVAIMLPNSPQSVITYYGALMAGGVVVQVNPLYTERELSYQLQDSGATFMICLDILLPRVSNVRGKTELEHVILTKVSDYLPFPKNIAYPFIQKKQTKMVVDVAETDDTHYLKHIIGSVSERYQPVDVDPEEDLALLQYTGGTTGRPKGVMLTHFNLVSNVEMCTSWVYKLEKNKESILGVLPFFHVYGMTTVMNLSIMFGSKMILLPKFDAAEVLKTIEKLKPTVFPGAPTIYIGLLNHPDIDKYDLSSIKASISGSAPLPVEVQEQFERVTQGSIVEGYGLTESSPVTHANLLWGERINGSIGLPWPDTEAMIVEEGTLNEVPVEEVGEIAVKGPQIMKGYWNREEETKATLKDGWLLTSDLGRMDEKGYFYVVDRKKDMIIAGGFNIYPREIEEVLYEHPDIQEAAVFGIPHDYRGETVKAVIVSKEGKVLSEKELEKYCRANLAAYKIPRIYEFREELPRNVIGKILKRELIDETIEQMDKEKRMIH